MEEQHIHLQIVIFVVKLEQNIKICIILKHSLYV